MFTFRPGNEQAGRPSSWQATCKLHAGADSGAKCTRTRTCGAAVGPDVEDSLDVQARLKQWCLGALLADVTDKRSHQKLPREYQHTGGENPAMAVDTALKRCKQIYKRARSAVGEES